MYSQLEGFMEEMIDTRVPADRVWQSWEKAHELKEGTEGKNKFHYKVFDVKKGESFSVLWKSLFVRLVFTQSVRPTPKGSQISYRVQIRGLFGWAIRLLAARKIKRNISHVLQSVVKELEKS